MSIEEIHRKIFDDIWDYCHDIRNANNNLLKIGKDITELINKRFNDE
jgi:fido (protein-threonine AMPylation protein)